MSLLHRYSWPQLNLNHTYLQESLGHVLYAPEEEGMAWVSSWPVPAICLLVTQHLKPQIEPLTALCHLNIQRALPGTAQLTVQGLRMMCSPLQLVWV